MFRSVIHLELIILYGVKEESMFITVYHVVIRTFPEHFPFPVELPSHLCLKSSDQIHSIFLDYLFRSFDLCLSFHQYQTVLIIEA